SGRQTALTESGRQVTVTESGRQIVRSGSVPALWQDETGAGSRSEEHKLLRFGSDADADLEQYQLPPFALRLATELVGELAVGDGALRAGYMHAMAGALRRSPRAEAWTLARDLDVDALESDPFLVPAYLTLVAEA